MKTVPVGPGELGVGGNAVMARIEKFEIGPYEIEAPLAAFAQGKLSSADDSQVAGEIGGGMLRRFTVTLDYARGVAFFDGNSEIRTDDREDMSGISVVASGPNLQTIRGRRRCAPAHPPPMPAFKKATSSKPWTTRLPPI